jgi:hypothetical protein
MGAANEPIIYAGAMIVSVLMMVIATTFSTGMLSQAYSMMELNHMRYQSAVASHNAIVGAEGYRISSSHFWDKVDNDGDNYCVMADGQEFAYLGQTPDSVNFTEMRVISSFTSNCNIDQDNLEGYDDPSSAIDTMLNLSAYPTMYSAMGSPAKAEWFVTLPGWLWE